MPRMVSTIYLNVQSSEVWLGLMVDWQLNIPSWKRSLFFFNLSRTQLILKGGMPPSPSPPTPRRKEPLLKFQSHPQHSQRYSNSLFRTRGEFRWREFGLQCQWRPARQVWSVSFRCTRNWGRIGICFMVSGALVFVAWWLSPPSPLPLMGSPRGVCATGVLHSFGANCS